jgi:hypothetical protein
MFMCRKSEQGAEIEIESLDKVDAIEISTGRAMNTEQKVPSGFTLSMLEALFSDLKS